MINRAQRRLEDVETIGDLNRLYIDGEGEFAIQFPAAARSKILGAYCDFLDTDFSETGGEVTAPVPLFRSKVSSLRPLGVDKWLCWVLKDSGNEIGRHLKKHGVHALDVPYPFIADTEFRAFLREMPQVNFEFVNKARAEGKTPTPSFSFRNQLAFWHEQEIAKEPLEDSTKLQLLEDLMMSWVIHLSPASEAYDASPFLPRKEKELLRQLAPQWDRPRSSDVMILFAKNNIPPQFMERVRGNGFADHVFRVVPDGVFMERYPDASRPKPRPLNASPHSEAYAA